jgi:hypothetical protein
MSTEEENETVRGRGRERTKYKENKIKRESGFI